MLKPILVTGCAGFIGSSLCESLLNKGFPVVGIDNFDDFYSRSIKEGNLANCLKNSNFTFHEIDINERDKLNSIKSDLALIIHLAAKAGVRPSIHNPAAYIQTNITGTQNILDLMKTRGIHKLVFASSSSVYGNSEIIPFSESANVDHPISPYAFTKKSCELMNYTYHHLYDMDIVNLRFFTVYGERQRPDLAIHKFVDAIFKDQPITMYGEGDTSRDYTYVWDIVDGVISAMNYVNTHNKVYEIINIGNHSPLSLRELIDLLYELTGKAPNIVYQEKQAGDVDITYADISKAQKLLNYKPHTDMKTGLKNFIAWYKDRNGR